MGILHPVSPSAENKKGDSSEKWRKPWKNQRIVRIWGIFNWLLVLRAMDWACQTFWNNEKKRFKLRQGRDLCWIGHEVWSFFWLYCYLLVFVFTCVVVAVSDLFLFLISLCWNILYLLDTHVRVNSVSYYKHIEQVCTKTKNSDFWLFLSEIEGSL